MNPAINETASSKYLQVFKYNQKKIKYINKKKIKYTNKTKK
jgi:hypothetical protein